uniref:THD domain-containing protein n=1 Tax=Pyxicephalus adspersus TaxID=30357 RepID=A0AAV3ACA0_PYXAD|nr:TPA: hypothetical protein GDO54_017658 [Pyxicephalus adspersus]
MTVLCLLKTGWIQLLGRLIFTYIEQLKLYIFLFQIQEIVEFNDDYVFLRKIQKCLKRESVDPTLLNCKEVIARFRSLISETVPAVAIHLVGDKVNSNKEVLQWQEKGYLSTRNEITYTSGKLRIETSGVYYIYSQVSFCVNLTQFQKAPFVQYIYLKRPYETDKPLLKGANTFVSSSANCALHTTQLGAVFTFRKNDFVFVNVTDPSCVNYSPEYTYFGMFKLGDTS